MANTLQPPSVSVPRAKGYTSYETGQCLNFVWRCIDGVTMAGYPDANTAFRNSEKVHAGDKNPPAGVPCYWTGSQYGHVALSLGDGNVRSTDYPSKGKVSTVSITTLTNAWGRKYEGWAEDYGGNDIPGISTDSSSGEEDMPSASEIANAVWNLVIPRPDNTPTAAKGQLGSANVNSYRALSEVRALTSMVEDMAAKVLTSEEFEAALARARAAAEAYAKHEDEETGDDQEDDQTTRTRGGPGEDEPSRGERGRRAGQHDG